MPPGKVAPVSTQRGGRVLATALVWGLLLTWAASVWMVVLVADGLGREHGHPRWWAHVVAAVLVAVTIVALRRWVQRGVDDVVYGHHGDALAVVDRINRQLDSGAAVWPGEEGSSIATTIARSLAVPFVAVVEGDVEISVAGPRPSARDLTDDPVGVPRSAHRAGPGGQATVRNPALPARPRTPRRPRPAAQRRHVRDPRLRADPGVASRPRHRARGGTPPDPPRPARRARPVAGVDEAATHRGQPPARLDPGPGR